MRKVETDLRTPRKGRALLDVHFDINDRQIGASVQHSSWYTISDSPELNVALSYAKEGQDTGAIPAPVSNRY